MADVHAFATTRRPTFKWKLPPGEDGAHVDVCVDRACTTVSASFDVTGSQGAPPQDIAAGNVFWRLRGKSGSRIGTEYGPIWEIVIPPASAPVGAAWGTLLDVNGDGYGDVAVGDMGAPKTDAGFGPGSVYVYLGSSQGISATETPIVLVGPDGGQFGSGLASAGDVNGDGFADLLVEAYSFGSYMGRAYLYLGGPNGPATKPSVVFLDPNHSANDGFGTTMLSLGDSNGDGYGDIALWGAAGNDTNLYVYLGGPNGPSSTPSTTLSNFGTTANAGDTNGDGYEDLIVTTGHAVTVHPGGPQGIPSSPALQITSPDSDAGAADFGNSPVASAGDVNCDGYADVLIDDQSFATPTGVGRAYLFEGAANGLSTTPAARLDSRSMATNPGVFGSAMSPLGNLLTGNECSSVGIGDYYYDVLYVWQGGPNGPASSPLAINGTNDYLGQSVTSSDVDGDARFEAIYTIPMDPSGPSVKIDAMMGPIQPAVLLHGPPGSSAQFGSSLAAR